MASFSPRQTNMLPVPERTAHGLESLLNAELSLRYVYEELSQMEVHRNRMLCTLECGSSDDDYAAGSELSSSLPSPVSNPWDWTRQNDDEEPRRTGWEILRGFIDNAKDHYWRGTGVSSTDCDDYEEYEGEETEEKDWLWQDKSDWPDAYRPDPVYAPETFTLDDSDAVADDTEEAAIDDLYVNDD